MTARRIVSAVLAGTVGLLGVYAAFQAVRLHPAQVRLQALRDRRVQLLVELRQRRQVPARVLPPARRAPRASSAEEKLLDTLRAHPELLPQYSRAERTRVAAQYRPVFHALKMTDAEIEEATRILADDAQSRLLSDRSDAGNGLPSALAALLGSERLARFTDLASTLNARLAVGMFAADLYAEHPLSPAQADALVLAWDPVIPAQPVIDSLVASPNDLPVDWDEVLTRAKPILSPAQYHFFELHARLNAEGRMN